MDMALTAVYVIISVIIVSLVSLVGVVTLLWKGKLEKILLLLVSLSAGTLFGGAFLHLLPEAIEKEGFSLTVSFLVLLGVMVFFILEMVIHWRHCHIYDEDTATHIRTHKAQHPPAHIAPLNLMGDALHNFVDGLVIAGAYMASIPVGIATTIAVVIHEVPQEIADFGVLLYTGLSKRKALMLNYVSAAVAILGAIVGLVIGSKSDYFIRFILPFAAGGFLYIAGSNLIPELQKKCEVKDSLWNFVMLLVGIALMYGLLFIE